MWYRKAIDLNELKKMYPEEAEEASGEFAASDLIEKLNKGEEWTSPSGAIKVRKNPKFEKFTKEEINSYFHFHDTITDFFESISGYPRNIDLVIETMNEINPPINDKIKKNAIAKLYALQKEWFKLIDKYEKPWEEEQNLNYQYEKKYVKPEDKQKAIEIIAEQTEVVSNVLLSIKDYDAQNELMRIMAKRGYKAMFITDKELKSRYLELLNETWKT